MDAIAYKLAVKYATMLGSAMLDEIRIDAKDAMQQLKNANTRRMQSIEYNRSTHFKVVVDTEQITLAEITAGKERV
jgi:hypothetical protein